VDRVIALSDSIYERLPHDGKVLTKEDMATTMKQRTLREELGVEYDSVVGAYFTIMQKLLLCPDLDRLGDGLDKNAASAAD
jgi:hypothetical protein